MKTKQELDMYFVEMNRAAKKEPMKLKSHTRSKPENLSSKAKIIVGVSTLFLSGLLAFGVGYSHVKNEMIEERGGTVDYVYNQEKTVVNMNGAEEPTFTEVTDRMFGKGQ